MRRIIDIDENLFVRLYDNGAELSKEDRKKLEIVVRNSDEIKTYKWIYHEEYAIDGECAYECSNCHTCYDYDMNYCGYCGADMRKE